MVALDDGIRRPYCRGVEPTSQPDPGVIDQAAYGRPVHVELGHAPDRARMACYPAADDAHKSNANTDAGEDKHSGNTAKTALPGTWRHDCRDSDSSPSDQPVIRRLG